MVLHWLSEACAVVAQENVLPNFESIKQAGITHIVNNQPYEEDSRGVICEMVAASYGITYSYLPFTFGDITAETVLSFSDMSNFESKPMLAFCRSGVRSAVIWVVSEVTNGRETLESALAAVADSGVNIMEARPIIDRLIAEINEMPHYAS